MDNTKRITDTLYGSCDESEVAHLKDIVPTHEGLIRRLADAAKQAHEDNLKTRKKEFRDFINHKGRRGIA